jgi:uncharacterized protein
MTDPATMVATRVVPVDATDDFRRWAEAMERSLLAVEGGQGTVRLEQAGGIVHLVHRFADQAALDRWTASADYRRLLADGERFAVERRQHASGPAVTFSIPAESAASKPKTFILTWVTVFPLLLLVSTAIRAIAGGLPQPVQLVITSLIMVATLTWVILPRVQRRLRPWTLADADGQARR